MKRGYIKTYRSLLDWEWFDDWKVLKVFLYLTLSCNYEEKDWKGIIIKPGQIVTSYSILSREINLSVREIRTAINKLKTTGEVTSKATSKYTVFTVQNWEKFQEEDFKKGEANMLLKGYGNAIVPEVAAEFLKAWMKETNQNLTN